MFIIWRGWGLLAVIIPPLFLFLSMLTADFVFERGFFELHSSWYMPLTLFLSSVTVYYLGKKLNSNNEKVLLDPETGEEVILKSSNDLFWIPMQYWGIAFGVISIFLFVVAGGLLNR